MVELCAAVAPEEAAGLGQRIELAYLTADGKGERKKLSQCWNLRFESVPPVRKFVSYKAHHLMGQHHDLRVLRCLAPAQRY